MPNGNSQWNSSQDTSTTSKRELDREAGAALLRVRTRPEGPEGNLRKLT